MSEIAERLLAGEQRALSRLITLLERGDPAAAEAMKVVDGHTGRAYTVGIYPSRPEYRSIWRIAGARPGEQG